MGAVGWTLDLPQKLAAHGWLPSSEFGPGRPGTETWGAALCEDPDPSPTGSADQRISTGLRPGTRLRGVGGVITPRGSCAPWWGGCCTASLGRTWEPVFLRVPDATQGEPRLPRPRRRGPQFPLWPRGPQRRAVGKRGPRRSHRAAVTPTNPRPQPPTWPRPRPASRAAGAGPGRGPELVKTPAVSEGSSFPTPEGRQALYRSIITRSQMVFWELRSPRAPLRRPRHSEAEPGTNAAAAGPGRASAAARRGNGRRARTHRPATERVCRPGPRGGGGAWRTPRGPLQVAPHPGDLGQGTAS